MQFIDLTNQFIGFMHSNSVITPYTNRLLMLFLLVINTHKPNNNDPLWYDQKLL